MLGREQGDQIGRIFARWVIAYLGQFFSEIKEVAQFLDYSLHSEDYLPINFDKPWAGLHFGPFFTNSSGHSGR
jgi:hypothetical protein